MNDVIETASTGRAKCRRCGQKIEKGELRFGEVVPNPFGEGEATHWFHLGCAAEKRPEKLAPTLTTYPGELPDREELQQIANEGAHNPKLASILQVEHSPSGRASCQHCRQKIGKGELRIAFERGDEPMGMTVNGYVHARCGPAFFGSKGLLSKLRRTTPNLSAEDEAELANTLDHAETGPVSEHASVP